MTFPVKAVLVLGSLVVLAVGGGTPQHANAQASTQSADPAVVVIDTVFDELEKRIIKEFGLEQRSRAEHDKDKGKGKGKSSAPPGLAKRDELPPGLARRDVLPPGLQGRGLPQDLEGRLPKAKPGTKRIQVGSDVVLIEEATRRVLDVLEDVLLPQQ